VSAAKKCRKILIVGTGTDIGKTHITASLLYALDQQGHKVVAWKPCASGVRGIDGDSIRFQGVVRKPSPAPVYSFPEPLSLHLAARKAGVAIKLRVILERMQQLENTCEILVVESAGGVFSPLNDNQTWVDLCPMMAPEQVILVAPDRLGVLHDVTSTVLAAKSKGLELQNIVLSAPSKADSSTGSNAAELETLGLGRVLGVFPRSEVIASTTQQQASRVLRRLGFLSE
jgi:dethiobiotin synthetase